MIRLTEGSQSVLDLLDKNPFSGSPPKYVRAILYNYSFTEEDEKNQTSAWWKRVRLGEYTPILSRLD